jgi:PTH2 family peptidyl-tRNA hydrolase
MGKRDTKQVIVVRSDLKMGRGKEDAQVAHASGAFMSRQIQSQIRSGKTSRFSVYLSKAEVRWVASSYAKVVLVAHSKEELLEIKKNALTAGLVVHEIVDSGRTQFKGEPTLTCIAIGPDYTDKIDPITGDLKMR